MHRNRPFAILIAFALSLQLMLAGKGEMCVGQTLDDGRTGMAMNMSSMRDMGMAGTGGAETASGVGTRRSSPAQDQQSGGAPCNRPSSTTTCQLFASCAAGFVAAPLGDVIARQERPASPRVTTIASLSSRTIAPELPPPRA